jgi:ABC-2 type transport system ATP-binding protein
VGLTPHRDRPLRGFSKGMLQRIGLAQALVHEPQLVFLDEPTSGLDPMGRRMVRDILRAERERGVTVFLNSHLLSEIEITCDRVVFIKRGEVVASRDLRAQQQEAISVAVHVDDVPAPAVTGLGRWTSQARVTGGRLSFTVTSEAVVPDIVRFLVNEGVAVSRVSTERTPLEEVFLTLMGEDPGL